MAKFHILNYSNKANISFKMKTCTPLLIFIFAAHLSYSQKISEMGLDKVRINQVNKTVVAEIKPTVSKVRMYADRYYYWYNANQIHHTQGGYGGRLLNGVYVEYYPDNNLMVYGYFKNGLKSGAWKNWNTEGKLTEYSLWSSGREQRMVSVDDSVKMKDNKISKPPVFKRKKRVN